MALSDVKEKRATSTFVKCDPFSCNTAMTRFLNPKETLFKTLQEGFLALWKCLLFIDFRKMCKRLFRITPFVECV